MKSFKKPGRGGRSQGARGLAARQGWLSWPDGWGDDENRRLRGR